jgi:3-hydroxyacyl-[acyl-carrier-protein] dehydratase
VSRAAEAGWVRTPGVVDVAAPLRAVEQWCCEPDGNSVRLTARVGVHGDDPNLRGHFPGLPIFPGIFVIESLCQAMAQAFGRDGGQPPVLRNLRSVRFLAPLLDGDELTLRITVTPATGGWSTKSEGTRLDGTVAARIRADFIAGQAADA